MKSEITYNVKCEDDITLDRYKAVYEGTAQSHRVTRLTPNSTYTFRVCCSNESGKGDWSSPTSFVTTERLPSAPKGSIICVYFMHVCVFMCVCVSMSVCVCAHVRACVCTCVCMFIHPSIVLCMCY